MNGKGISGIVGTIILVAVVVGIAASLYVFVCNEQGKIEKARDIDLSIKDHSVDNNGALQMTLGFINNGSKINANITISVEQLMIQGRVESNQTFVFTKTINTTIDAGVSEKTVAEPTNLSINNTYKVNVSLITQYENQIESFYIFSE